jgi:hypothetical protein
MKRDLPTGSGSPITVRAPSIHRRSFVVGAAASLAAMAWPIGVRAEAGADDSALEKALAGSYVVYLSPLKSDGSESFCHAEVWYVMDGDDVLVVTSADRWRAVAIAKGLDRARLWVGEHGIWKRAGKAWEQDPTVDATGTIEGDGKAHERALATFGAKYAKEWGKWGPRFEKGLTSGERVLIRYTLDAA